MDSDLIIQLTRLSNEIHDSIAELPSSCSDISDRTLTGKIFSARQAMCLIFISLYFPYWETDRLIKSIAHKAYQCNYNGYWAVVQKFIEQKEIFSLNDSVPIKFFELYLEEHSTNVLFGSLRMEVKKYIKLLRLTSSQNLSKVNRPKRKRGYDDKGSLRRAHEFHGEPKVNNERLDRRKQVKHPLLEDFTETISKWDKTASWEGENSDD